MESKRCTCDDIRCLASWIGADGRHHGKLSAVPAYSSVLIANQLPAKAFTPDIDTAVFLTGVDQEHQGIIRHGASAWTHSLR